MICAGRVWESGGSRGRIVRIWRGRAFFGAGRGMCLLRRGDACILGLRGDVVEESLAR